MNSPYRPLPKVSPLNYFLDIEPSSSKDVTRATRGQPKRLNSLKRNGGDFIVYFTITAEIHARSLANFYCQYADRHIHLKFMRPVSERERAIRQFVIVKNKPKIEYRLVDPQLLWQCYDKTHDQYQERRIKNWRQFVFVFFMFSELSPVFSFGRGFVCFVVVSLFITWLFLPFQGV